MIKGAMIYFLCGQIFSGGPKVILVRGLCLPVKKMSRVFISVTRGYDPLLSCVEYTPILKLKK
jgi:hypothetical protein